MKQQNSTAWWISRESTRLQLLVDSFVWFEDVAESSPAHLVYDVLDRELFLSPVELTTRWIDRVSRQVSLLLSEPEETNQISSEKKELVEEFRSRALGIFLWKLQELPFFKKILIQSLYLWEADSLIQDRAIASLLRIPPSQFDSLMAFFASEPRIWDLMHHLKIKYVPGLKSDPKWGSFTIHLSGEGYAKGQALKGQFSEIRIETQLATAKIFEIEGIPIHVIRNTPILRIPERLAGRYQLSHAPKEAVTVVRQRFVDAVSEVPLYKKLSFPTPRLPDFFGSTKPQMN